MVLLFTLGEPSFHRLKTVEFTLGVINEHVSFCRVENEDWKGKLAS